MCKGTAANVEVKVDVTKIVKYVCIAGTAIVAIIFGSRCAKACLGQSEEDQKVQYVKRSI